MTIVFELLIGDFCIDKVWSNPEDGVITQFWHPPRELGSYTRHRSDLVSQIIAEWQQLQAEMVQSLFSPMDLTDYYLPNHSQQ